MEKTKTLKIIISICLVTLTILPMINKEMFVSNTGNISHPDSFFIFLIIIGLFKKWKHLKEILLIIMIIIFISLLIWIILGIINNGLLNIKIGHYFNLCLLLITILSVNKLRRLKEY